jgi:hypothetical protein
VLVPTHSGVGVGALPPILACCALTMAACASYTDIHVYACIYVDVYICMYTYICRCIYVYGDTNTHTRIYTTHKKRHSYALLQEMWDQTHGFRVEGLVIVS